jgi:hypothetical protein
LPVFLTGDAQLYEELRGSSWLLKAGLFVLVVAAIVIGAAMMLSLGYPMRMFADAAPTDPPATQSISDRSTPPTTLQRQSTVDAGQTVGSAPNRGEVADATAPASDSQPETREPASGTLLKQFQSWAASQDSQAEPTQDTPTQVEPVRPIQDAPTQVEPVRPIVQDTQAPVEPIRPIQDAATQAESTPPVRDTQTQVSQDNPAPVHAVRKHRKGPTVQNARAEVRPTAKPARASTRQYWNASAETPRTLQDARLPQDPRPDPQPAQNAQSPSLLRNLGISH